MFSRAVIVTLCLVSDLSPLGETSLCQRNLEKGGVRGEGGVRDGCSAEAPLDGVGEPQLAGDCWRPWAPVHQEGRSSEGSCGSEVRGRGELEEQ